MPAPAILLGFGLIGFLFIVASENKDKARKPQPPKDTNENLRSLLSCCDSPIEQLIAQELFFQLPLAIRQQPDKSYYMIGRFSGKTLIIVPQHSVTFENKNFRLDFLIKVEVEKLSLFENAKYRNFAIEADGHSFHNTTPQQAQRDRSRDRILSRNNITTLRFTGREIWNSPNLVVKEILKHLSP